MTAGYKSFREVQTQIEKEVKMIKRKRRYDKMIERIVSKANIVNMDDFLTVCLEEAYNRYSSR